MTRYVDDKLLTILYHQIGADAVSGIRAFELTFRDAEANYRVDDLRALLTLLHDRTLFDPSLPAWHDYFSIRMNLLQWQLAKAEELLARAMMAKKGYEDPLKLRLDLLRGQMQVMRGEWTSGLQILRTVSRRLADPDTPLLAIDRDEWTARAFLGRAQSSGDWEAPHNGTSARVWRYLSTALLFPLYLLAYAALLQISAKEFWPAVLRYGSDISNWPVFAYYLSAYRALGRALDYAPQLARNRVLGLRLLQADLLRRIGNLPTSKRAYETLQDEFTGTEDTYEAALINHGLGQVLLVTGGNVEARACFYRARDVYDRVLKNLQGNGDAESFGHRRLATHLEMLLGDAALRDGLFDEAVNRWTQALHMFQQLDDASGTADVLNRIYFAAESFPNELPELHQLIGDRLNALRFRVYPLRMPNRLFAVLQSLSWLLPLLALIGVGAFVSGVIVGPPREQVAQQAASVLSLQYALKLLAIALVLALANSALAVIGLISSLWMDATRLDVFKVDDNGLTRNDCLGAVLETVSWAEVDRFLRVERCFWRKPSRMFSYDYLHSTKGAALRLPGMTSRFAWLQQDIEQCMAKAPIHYRLRWYGGIAVFAVPFALALTFTLTQTAVPGISVWSHAWLASIIAGLGYILLSVFGVSVIWHYVQVGSQTTPPQAFRRATGLLGLLMLALGTIGRDLGTIFSPFFVLGSLVIGLAWFRSASRQWLTQRRRLVRVVRLIIVVVGVLLVLWSVAPILASYHAYTYSGAASLFHPDCSTEDLSDRARCFDAMRRSGELVTQIDPTFYNGYGYMGLAHYHAHEYSQSIEDFSRAIYFNRVRPYPDYYYCRALAYMQNGQISEAQRDCRRFQERRSLKGQTLCERLFPEDAGACAEQDAHPSSIPDRD